MPVLLIFAYRNASYLLKTSLQLIEKTA